MSRLWAMGKTTITSSDLLQNSGLWNIQTKAVRILRTSGATFERVARHSAALAQRRSLPQAPI